MIVTLDQPPLAAAHYARTMLGGRAAGQLNVHSSSSRAYLASLDRLQAAAVAKLHRAIPQATVGRRLKIILDGLTVTLPVTQLPKLYKLGIAKRVYPSARFTMNLDDSPSLIGATAFINRTGANGEGMKIAVVDDGIDQTSTFFDPKGYAYPPGFPLGQKDFTTPKVIVARAYPGPGSGKPGQLPLDRKASFHGTHVAGIAAGNSGTTAPAGPDHPEVKGLTGVAPRAWLGNYRVFNAPTPAGNSAFTPQIVAAFEDAVADGMDVINFSGGGPMNDPENDALVEAVHNVAAAGVVPVISAGNDRDDFGLGSVGRARLGAGRDRRRRGLEHPRLRPRADGDRARRPEADPDQQGGELDPVRLGLGRREAGRHRDDRRHRRQGGRPLPVRPGDEPRGRVEHAARRLAERRDRARLARLLHVRLEGVPREGRRSGRDRLRGQPSRRGERRPARRGHPRRHDRRRRRRRPARGAEAHGGRGLGAHRPRPARDRDRPRRHADELLLRRPRSVLPRPEAGPRRSRRRDPLLDAARDDRRAVRRLRRDEHGGAARRRRGRAARSSGIRSGAPTRSSRR